MTYDETVAWYALVVKKNWEQSVSSSLRLKGIEEFLPTYHITRAWADRAKHLERPYFPGYVFCRISPQTPASVVTTPGVISFLGFGNGRAPIPDSEIQSVKRVLEAQLPLADVSYVREGQKVKITEGPLRNVEGIIQRTTDVAHLVVSVTLLHRSLSVSLDRTHVVALNCSTFNQLP